MYYSVKFLAVLYKITLLNNLFGGRLVPVLSRQNSDFNLKSGSRTIFITDRMSCAEFGLRYIY
jgi:hypothetical protein